MARINIFLVGLIGFVAGVLLSLLLVSMTSTEETRERSCGPTLSPPDAVGDAHSTDEPNSGGVEGRPTEVRANPAAKPKVGWGTLAEVPTLLGPGSRAHRLLQAIDQNFDLVPCCWAMRAGSPPVLHIDATQLGDSKIHMEMIVPASEQGDPDPCVSVCYKPAPFCLDIAGATAYRNKMVAFVAHEIGMPDDQVTLVKEIMDRVPLSNKPLVRGQVRSFAERLPTAAQKRFAVCLLCALEPQKQNELDVLLACDGPIVGFDLSDNWQVEVAFMPIERGVLYPECIGREISDWWSVRLSTRRWGRVLTSSDPLVLSGKQTALEWPHLSESETREFLGSPIP